VLYFFSISISFVHVYDDNYLINPIDYRFFAGSKEKADDVFVVNHFAGPVRYSSHKFLEKNHDVVRPDMANLVRNSGCQLVSSLADFFRVEEDATGTNGAPNRLQPPGTAANGARASAAKPVIRRANSMRNSGFAKIQTLSGEFRSQLEELMENINTTSPHYVR
jgi:myosin V